MNISSFMLDKFKSVRDSAEASLALQKLTTAPRVVLSDAVDISDVEKVAFHCLLGRLATSAFTAGVKINVAVSPFASGDGENYWSTAVSMLSSVGANIGDEAVNGTCAAGQATVGMASTTNFTVGELVYIDNPTLANSEFGQVVAVTTNTSVTLLRNLDNAQTGATVWGQAERFSCELDVSAYQRLQIVVDGSGAGQNFAVMASIAKLSHIARTNT